MSPLTGKTPEEEQREADLLKGIELIPLCRVPRCEKIEGHDGEHGPTKFNMSPLVVRG